MKPSDFQKTIQCQFDCKLKRVVRGIVRNYRKELRRRRNKEIAFCEIPEIVIEKLAVWDEYEGDYTSFHVCGVEIRVLDDELAEALKSLPERERDIVLMYFFLDMSDMEIGKNKEDNIKSIINLVPDILLAPPRAMLTIELIPRFLKLFGMEKQKKSAPPQEGTQQKTNNTTFKAAAAKIPTFATIKSHSGSAPQKGGI